MKNILQRKTEAGLLW